MGETRRDSGGSIVSQTSYSYDAVGNRTAVTDALGLTTSYSYDAANRLVAIDYPTPDSDVSFSYDLVGNLTGMVDGVGTTTFSYDDLNRLTAVVDPFGNMVGYGYDSVGNRTSLQYPDGKVVSYQYDPADRLVQVSDWDSRQTHYQYDGANRLVERELPNGVTTRYQYDPPSRLVGLDHQRGSAVLASYGYSYDGAGNLVHSVESLEASFHRLYLPIVASSAGSGSGGLVESTPFSPTPTASGTPEVDPAVTLTATAPGVPSTVTPTLDSTGRSTPTVASPPTSTPEQEPTESSTPTDSWTAEVAPTLEQQSTSTPTPTPTSADAILALTPEDRAASAPRDESGEPGSPYHRAALGVPERSSAAHGADGDLESMTRTIDYSYDPLHRLTTADYSSGEFFHYTYDAVGNRLSLDTGAGVENYSYDAADRLVEVDGSSFAWDDKGNLISDGEYTYEYDHANRLTSLSGPKGSFGFEYNGLGDRLARTGDGGPVEYSLDLQAPFTQVLASDSSTYLYGIGRIAEEGAEGWSHHLTDQLGSVRQLADEDGTLTRAAWFTPYGEVLAQAGSAETAYGFAGEWTDPGGLLHLRARYYAPGQGRFLTRDPFPGLTSLPVTLHPYLYAFDSPLRYTDPSGQIPPLLLALAAGALIGGGIAYGSQVFQNYQNGLTGPDAWFHCIDWWDVGLGAAEGSLFAGLGFLTGGLIYGAGLRGLTAFAAAAIVDLEAGMIWDLAVRGYTPSEALVSNVLAFGFGEVIGFGVRSLGRGLPDLFGGLRPGTLINDGPRISPFGEIKPFGDLPRRSGYERHHLIERRLAERLAVEPDEIPAVYVRRPEHQPFTNRWRGAIGYRGQSNPIDTDSFTYDDVVRAVNQVYQDQPELLEASLEFLAISR